MNNRDGIVHCAVLIVLSCALAFEWRSGSLLRNQFNELGLSSRKVIRLIVSGGGSAGRWAPGYSFDTNVLLLLVVFLLVLLIITLVLLVFFRLILNREQFDLKDQSSIRPNLRARTSRAVGQG